MSSAPNAPQDLDDDALEAAEGAGEATYHTITLENGTIAAPRQEQLSKVAGKGPMVFTSDGDK